MENNEEKIDNIEGSEIKKPTPPTSLEEIGQPDDDPPPKPPEGDE